MIFMVCLSFFSFAFLQSIIKPFKSKKEKSHILWRLIRRTPLKPSVVLGQFNNFAINKIWKSQVPDPINTNDTFSFLKKKKCEASEMNNHRPWWLISFEKDTQRKWSYFSDLPRMKSFFCLRILLFQLMTCFCCCK